MDGWKEGWEEDECEKNGWKKIAEKKMDKIIE